MAIFPSTAPSPVQLGGNLKIELTTDTDTTSTERIIYAINNWLSDTFHKRLFTNYLCQLADFD